jgi:two-component system, NarL family, nitrate/nitrite response regulator NarL
MVWNRAGGKTKRARNLVGNVATARLLVADQSRMNCQLIVAALKRSRAIEVVARATNSEEIFAQVRSNHPDVALIGANLQDGSLAGFAVVRKLRHSHPSVRCILLLDSADRGWVIDAFRAGAKGIFCRDDSLTLLSRSIQTVRAGQIWANNEQIGSVLEAFARVAPPTFSSQNARASLSRRERQVTELVSEGFSNREIAAQLQLSEHTVKNYIFHIFEKLGIASRLELVLFARSRDKVEQGHAEPEQS